MNVNGEKYSVYPDYMQLLKKNPLDSHTDIYAPVNVSNSKKLVLSQFFDVLQKN